ncbi:hypothetical protein ACOMHN_003793 [Nucella lapillus]
MTPPNTLDKGDGDDEAADGHLPCLSNGIQPECACRCRLHSSASEERAASEETSSTCSHQPQRRRMLQKMMMMMMMMMMVVVMGMVATVVFVTLDVSPTGTQFGASETKQCKKSCPKGHYLLSSCSDYSEPVCIPCSRCSRTQYEAAACISGSDTLCVDVTFPLRLLPTNGTNCTDAKEPVSVTHSKNVFVERLVSMKELETPMYVTNNQQTQDFVWHRDSGIDIVVGISGVYLIPEYRETDAAADDSLFFQTQSMQTQMRIGLFAHTRKMYCRHPVPDYYHLHLEVIKNRTTAAQVVRCDSQDPKVPRCPNSYRDGDRYLKWDINKRCFKYNSPGSSSSSTPLEVLRDGFNTIVCTDETSLDREVFGVWRPVTLEMMLPSTACAMARQQCDFCLSLSACHGVDKHKSCCGISCYRKDPCHKLYTNTCPPPQVECATGEVHIFTVIPEFSSISEGWQCHLSYQQPAYLYNISYTVSIPDLGLQLPTQTYTAGLKGLEDHRKRADQFHFIRVWHDTRMPVDKEVLLRGNHVELGATNPSHMQPFLLHSLKAPNEFSHGGPRGFVTSKKGAGAYSTAVQFERPFLYSSTSWYRDGCLKNVSRIFPNQTLYREGEEGVRVMAKKVDSGGSFWYQMSHEEKSPYIKLSVPEGESILQWFMGRTVEGRLDGRTLSAHLTWDHSLSLWTIHLTGRVKNCPAIFTLQIYNKMAASCAAIYDVVVACPNNFTLTFNLSRSGDEENLPDVFVLVLKDRSASHRMVVASVVSPVNLPVSSRYARPSSQGGRGDSHWPEWSPVLGVGVVYFTGLGLLLGLYFHIRCSADRIAGQGSGGFPQSQQPTDKSCQDYRHADGNLPDYRHQDDNLHDYRHQDGNLPDYRHADGSLPDYRHSDGDLHDYRRSEGDSQDNDHIDGDLNNGKHTEGNNFCEPKPNQQYTEKVWFDQRQQHHPETNLPSDRLPETGLYDLQHTETCPQNYQQFEMLPLRRLDQQETTNCYHSDDTSQHQNPSELNPSNQSQDKGKNHVRDNPNKDTPNESKPCTRKWLCLFVQLYVVYSLIFTFSVPLSILYVTHHAIIGSGREMGNFSWDIQRELNASFHKVRLHEREEELRLFQSVDSRLKACAYHLQDQNRQFLQTYQNHLGEFLSHVYLQGGAVDSLAGMSIMQNSSLYAEEIRQFLMDCNKTVQGILDRFDAFFLLSSKDLSRKSWLDFVREIFLTQEGDAADRRYMSLGQLTSFLHWMQVDKIHELFSVSRVVAEGLAELKLPSASEHLKRTVTSPFEALVTSLPSEPMVAAHTFLVLHPPPPSLSPTPLYPSPTLSGSLTPHPQAGLFYNDRSSDRMEFHGRDANQGFNGSYNNQHLVGDDESSSREESSLRGKSSPRGSADEEDGEAVWLYVVITMCLVIDILLFIFRMSWMVRQLKAAKDGYEEKIPTDPVCQKLLAIQTGHPISRMQDLYQAHSYSRQNKENLTSEERASENGLNVYFCRSSPRSKDDILFQIMQQKINGGNIGRGQRGGGVGEGGGMGGGVVGGIGGGGLGGGGIGGGVGGLGGGGLGGRSGDRNASSPQHVASPSRAVRGMESAGCWLQRLLVSQLLWRFAVTSVLLVLLCVLLYTADCWLTVHNLRVLVGGQTALRDLYLQVHMTNRHLTDLASHLTTVLQEHSDTVRAEMAGATDLLSATLNTQRDLLINLLEQLCSGTATPMCETLSNFSDLPLPQLPVWQPCVFLPPLPSLYHDVQGEHLNQLVDQQLSPLLQTARQWLSSMVSIVIAVLCLLFLCHAAATLIRSHLLLGNHLARVPVFQISDSGSVMWDGGPECRKPMQRSASWLESCESGVYVGDNEAPDSAHPTRDV